MSYRIEFKKGSGLNPEYANVPLFSDLEYSTNIVGALTQSAVTGDNKPLCEPWFDKASKQLWVDKQVINPKIIADTTEGHTGIEIGNVYWDQLTGATLKIGLNQSLLPAAVTNELITGTEASSITTEVARYNPHSSTVEAPYSPLNAIYFGDGLTYTVVNGVGVLSCALLDTFVNSASYDPLSYTLTISLTTGDTFDIDLASLIDDTHAPAFGRIQTDNLPVTTAVYKNTGIAQATISEDSLQLIGGNKWIEAGVYTVGNDKSIHLGHALSSVEPTTDHLNKKTTVKEYSYDAAGHITGETTFDIDFSQGVIDTYYSALYTLYANGELVKGAMYRIIDYETTTIQAYTNVAHHDFDLVVTAISESELSPKAYAIQKSGDTYFSTYNADLSKWEIWYDINNDQDKYMWADPINGKGVIYRMIDEYENDCPYDFKNILFERRLTNGGLDVDDGVDTNVYTFNLYLQGTNTVGDASVIQPQNEAQNYLYTRNNIIGTLWYNAKGQNDRDIRKLNDIVFLSVATISGEASLNYLNVFGINCENNTIGTDCHSNTFGDYCSNNVFGDFCQNNTLGSYCLNNTLGFSCYGNIIHNNLTNSIFGNLCSRNIINATCNRITFGNSNRDNYIDSQCSYITLSDFCSNNKIGTECDFITFGNQSNQYGTYIQDVIINSDNHNINIYNNGLADSSHYLQHIYIAQGFSTGSQINITSVARGNNFRTTISRASNGDIRTYNEDDPIPAQVQADWNEDDDTSLAHILNKPTIPEQVTLRTMNHEQLTDSGLGDINIHDGFYFPNAVQDYDGNWYGAVVIGEQVWLAENLRTTHYADGTSIDSGGTTLYSSETPYYYNYNNSSIPYEERGLLYNWAAVMNGASPSNINPSGVVGLAPGTQAKGDNIWHIPSSQEFSALTTYLGKQKRFIFLENNAYIGKAVASSKYWTASAIDYAVGNDLTINNRSGFNAIPAGIFNASYIGTVTPPISGQYESVNFWTTSQNNSTTSYTRSVSYSSYRGLQSQSAQKINGYSVRCVSDLSPVQFRNWYIAQYGSLQHHLSEDSIGDNIFDGYYFPNAVQDADGNWYGATVIGDQVWMGENFKCTSFPDGTPIANGSPSVNSGTEQSSTSIPYYYWTDDDPNTASDGLRYNGSALMNGDSVSNTNPSGVQGLSPNGWHVPSNAEYRELLDYVVSNEKYLATVSGNRVATPVLTKKEYYGGSLDSLPENYNKIINATGFGLTSSILLTCTEISVDQLNRETISAFTRVVAGDLRQLFSISAINLLIDQNHPGSSGAKVRLLSDMTPIQFRNWYVSTYGSMQHHIVDDVTNDQLNFVVEVTRNNVDNVVTYTCNKTGKDVYENVCVKKKNLIVALKSSSSSTGHMLLFKRNESITTPANGSTRYSAYLVDDDPTNFFDSVIIYSLVASYKEDGTINEITFSKYMDYDGWRAKQIDWENIIAVTDQDDSLPIYTHDGEYYPNAIQDYDGNWYGAVIIGNQVWLGENLKTTSYADGTPIVNGESNTSDSIGYYYEINDQTGMKNLGHRYNWMAIMNGSSSSTAKPSGVQGVAPNGCHIPSAAEWTELMTYTLNKIGKFGLYHTKALSSQLAPYSSYGDNSHTLPKIHPEYNNYTGFTAIPAGYGGNTPFMVSVACAFATSTTAEAGGYMQVYRYDASVANENQFALRLERETTGVSVRCVVDKTPMQFRAWYMEQYGSMQHHLSDNEYVTTTDETASTSNEVITFTGIRNCQVLNFDVGTVSGTLDITVETDGYGENQILLNNGNGGNVIVTFSAVVLNGTSLSGSNIYVSSDQIEVEDGKSMLVNVLCYHTSSGDKAVITVSDTLEPLA